MKMSLAAFLAFAATIGSARSSRATCCAEDADCPRGFRCLLNEQTDGDGKSGTCSGDLLDACQCDDDCAPGLRCVQSTANLCTTRGDASSCGPARACVAPWQAPCASDADCGSGFRCAENGRQCGPTGCETLTSCEQVAVPDGCGADGDCPKGWTCENDDAWSDQCVRWYGSCPAEGSCPPRAGTNQCRPPHWALVGARQFAGSAASGHACSSSEAAASGCQTGLWSAPNAWPACLVAACAVFLRRRRRLAS